MAINAFKNRESYKYTLQLDGLVIRKRGVIMAKHIKWYNICSQTYLPYDLAIDKCRAYHLGGIPSRPYCAVIYCCMSIKWHDDISEHKTFLFHS